MTRKDYKIIANVLSTAVMDCKSGTEEDVIFITRVVVDMASELYDDNHNFNHQKFYEACGLDPDETEIR